ncbi:Mitochondrial substrate/solute carrier [Sesbania bispinosa]|nr:Mitochondrial substrate/solute carrier [Sesbania bispinosa]
MSLSQTEDDSISEAHIQVPAEIDWHMLDKSKFFFLGAALFSGLSAALYPVVVLKTRQQVSSAKISCRNMSSAIMRYEGFRGFYRGFGTSLMGTIPARALYMSALEVTKSHVGTASVQLGQRLMVQGSSNKYNNVIHDLNSYRNGFDAFRKILCADGLRGLYRGFGVSIVTYAPSNAVWPDSKAMVGVQGLSAVMASGISAIMTMPLDTVKTRLQVLDAEENGRRKPLTFLETVRNLMKEGGVKACYRGLGPRWASMSMSATTMITTYEFLKRMSTKNLDRLNELRDSI